MLTVLTMRPTLATVLAALALVANGAVLPRQTNTAPDFDAIVVGGGPAGLAALSGLARVRRKVLLIDSGIYRNAPTRHMHDVLGFDGGSHSSGIAGFGNNSSVSRRHARLLPLGSSPATLSLRHGDHDQRHRH